MNSQFLTQYRRESDALAYLAGVGCALLGHSKTADAGDPKPVASLSGELYLSKSGWLLLRVPNEFGRGVYSQLSEPGVELPADYNAHISVMTKSEVEQIGAGRIKERGRSYRYQIGPLCTVVPAGQSDTFSRVWFVRVEAPSLETLRKTYGLSPLPNGHQFHITVAYRRRGVLGNNDIAIAAT